ncbi:imidazolonepropionase [Mycoplasmatota bacterium]|nr:imidazolonepropionase [Mycoplasmatota bacterium]
MKSDLIIHHISNLITMEGSNGIRCGNKMKEVETIKNAYVVVKDGVIVKVSSGDSYQDYISENTKLVNAKGYLMTPGLIDSHTHLVHGGSRENELNMKLQGKTYLDILEAGGGILSTVKHTKEASFEDLYNKAKKSLDSMLCYGVTSIEAKSGYGLNLEIEMKQLEVAKRLNEDHPIDIKNTFLGAHAVPLAFKNNKVSYIEKVIEMLPVIKEKNLADYCDVFCEEGVFSLEESRTILQKAKETGYKLKIHADEIIPLGGATLACELGCVSADHLMASTKKDYENLAKSRVIANLLPATSFNLNKDYAKAREMIDTGCGVALSSDYNPGSCPSENLQFVMQLGCIKMKMLPQEVLTAVTINGACSINEEKYKGSIEVGKAADFVLFDVPNLEYLIYHFGINHVKDVYKDGKLVVNNQKVCY